MTDKLSSVLSPKRRYRKRNPRNSADLSAPRDASNLPKFTPAHAPPAAQSRAERRAWAAECRRVWRRTCDVVAALKAGAATVIAMRDMDGQLSEIASGRGVGAPAAGIHMSGDARARMMNIGGAMDRAIDAVMRGETL